MMNIKHLITIVLLLPVFSCEQIETTHDQHPEEGTPVYFSLDTKSLPKGERTYRVVMCSNEGSLNGNGTYYSREVDHGKMGTWLSPCLVNDAGDALKNDRTPAASFEEADKSSIHGLRYSVTYQERQLLAVASPAVKVNNDGGKTFFQWMADKELYLSDFETITWEGSWIGENYVFDPQKESTNLKLLDRRARIFVHIECGELDHADIQFVKLSHVNQARWYIPGGFSAKEGHYSRTPVPETLYDCGEGEVKHIEKNNGDVWESEGTYILPLKYTEQQYEAMKPVVQIGLGTDKNKPATTRIEISDNLEPMKDYLMTLQVSKQYITCELSALPWYDGGLISTSDEERWANPSIVSTTTWETLEAIDTDDWNTSL